MADSARAPAVPIPRPGPSGGNNREDEVSPPKFDEPTPLTPAPTAPASPGPPSRTLDPDVSLNACSPDSRVRIAVLSISNVHRDCLAEGTLTVRRKQTTLASRSRVLHYNSHPRPTCQSFERAQTSLNVQMGFHQARSDRRISQHVDIPQSVEIRYPGHENVVTLHSKGYVNIDRRATEAPVTHGQPQPADLVLPLKTLEDSDDVARRRQASRQGFLGRPGARGRRSEEQQDRVWGSEQRSNNYWSTHYRHAFPRLY